MNSHDLLLVHTGTVIEEDSLTLGQLCRACGAMQTGLSVWLKKVLLSHREKKCAYGAFQEQAWFAPFCLRLQRDLGVNLAGIALALDLMEELKSLRTQMKTLGHV